MATSITFTCGVCDSQHFTKDAEHWCPECDEGLCPNCLIFHNSSKFSRDHGVISMENYKRLPQYITSIRQHCPDHDRKNQNYCPSHAVPCCPFCISTSHSECKGLQVLEEVVKTSELSSHFEDMKQTLKDVENNIKRIKIDREGNLKSIQEQRNKFQSEIKQVRQQINSHLDKLERQALENIKATEDKVKHQVETLLSKLSRSSREGKDLENIISAMTDYASDLQRFLGKKQIESEVAKSERYINSLVEDGSLQQVSLNCSIDSNVSGILSSISSFCTISTELSNPNILLMKEKEKQAQIMTVQPPAQTSIHDTKIQLIQTFTLPKGRNPTYIIGCTINQSGKMVFADYSDNQRLIILNADGSVDGEIQLPDSFDVTSIDNRSVAIIQREKIQVIDLSSNRIKKTIKLNNRVKSGISYGQHTLFYCEPGKNIHMLKPTDGSHQNSIDINNEAKGTNYVAFHQNNLYLTNETNHTVTCYKVSGEKVWEFRDETVICSPRAVSCDKYSNVYVASRGNNSIVVISPDGTQSRTLISQTMVFAIDVDKERNILIAAVFASNTVNIYKID
ncbi:Hypothetical predicted protein [Mytilus galloprovincialis]|uniref:B box-type domain-containing protein n=1 Tax=Mytilus galloprovincialis TaxID=29158 RepID=A0A8B6FUG3_MYTGA|nr:Hypothetical predicted protein [Mytilus galloprovincialis]